MSALKKALLGIIFTCAFNFLEAANFSLCDKFKRAKPGDFIVTEQDKNFSILFVKSKTEESIIFEEINVPQSEIDSKKKSWQEYINAQAPQNTSWLLFELSLKNGEVIECYSLSQRSWISFDDNEHFLSKFFCLTLSETPPQNRRKIGPPPLSDETDRRSYWYPPLFVSGKKKEKPNFDVRESRWASDGTLLANSHIEMFFNAEDPTYPFPVWIEVNNGHYGFKIRAHDTGHGLISPFQRDIPRRPPLIAGGFSVYKESIEIPLKCPLYAKKFSVAAIDFDNPSLRTEIDHTLVATDKKEFYILKLERKKITSLLKSGKRYRLSLMPTGQQAFFIETQDSFVMP